MEATPKYQMVIQTLEEEIQAGKYRIGQKIPSEMMLVRRFKSSRITVGRALRELTQSGLVERRPGSGTYVRPARTSGVPLGVLLVDRADPEIFDPICAGMSSALRLGSNPLYWGDSKALTESRQERTWQLCQQYIKRGVAGVFFAPLEGCADSDITNQKIISTLRQAGIAIVLLDRDVARFPEHSEFDVVGIDNRRAGFVITQHLLQLGHRSICFLARPNSAPTVNARMVGYQEAMHLHLGSATPCPVRFASPFDEIEIKRIMLELLPDAFVCANDCTAIDLSGTLLRLGFRVPDEIRLAGFDDVRDVTSLPVPFSTIHQPCEEIGRVAMSIMQERLARPDLPCHDVRVGFKLVVRDKYMFSNHSTPC